MVQPTGNNSSSAVSKKKDAKEESSFKQGDSAISSNSNSLKRPREDSIDGNAFCANTQPSANETQAIGTMEPCHLETSHSSHPRLVPSKVAPVHRKGKPGASSDSKHVARRPQKSIYQRLCEDLDLKMPSTTSIHSHHQASQNPRADGTVVTIVGDTSSAPLSRDSSARNLQPSSLSSIVQTHPEELLKSILEENGYPSAPVPFHQVKNFFLETSRHHLAAYTTDVVKAVQQDDISELTRLLHSGKTLQCCNKFGESIVHMACRRGSAQVVRFLVTTAKVSIRLVDDYGRTPLHDACWTTQPDFDVMKILIQTCPELLLISDKRGHTPLSYSRQDYQTQWCDFLRQHKHLLHPRELHQDQASGQVST